MAEKLKSFEVDVDFYSMVLLVKAKNKTEAKRKAKAQIAKKINSHINHLYVQEA